MDESNFGDDFRAWKKGKLAHKGLDEICIPHHMEIHVDNAPIFHLPDELILKIFHFLDEDLFSAALVCKYWNGLCAQEYFLRGMAALEIYHDNYSAIQHFTKSIQLHQLQPNLAFPAYFKRGVAYYKENDDVKAVQSMDKALQLNPPEAEVFIIRSMKAQIELDFHQAVQEASKAIELDPTNGNAYYLRGYNKFDTQDYEGAIHDLTLCLSLPYSYKSKVYNCRGWCYKVVGKTVEALQDFTQSSRQNPYYTKPFVNKAMILSKYPKHEFYPTVDYSKFLLYKGTEKAAEHLQIPLGAFKYSTAEDETFLTEFLEKCDPKHRSAVYYTRGVIRQQAKNYPGALEDFTLAVENGCHSMHKAYVSMGWSCEKMGKVDKALEHYDKSILINPNYSIAIEHRAAVYSRSEIHKVLEDCRKAITLNPKNLSFSFRYVAAVEADKGNYLKAIEILSDGLKTNKLDIDMLVNRAGYLTCLGLIDRAMKDYDLCIAHRPDIYEGWKYRGNIRFAEGKLHDCLNDYRQVIEKEPCDVFTWNNIGLVYMALGKFADARRCFETVPQLKGGDQAFLIVQDNLHLCENLEHVSHAVSEETLDQVTTWSRKRGSVLLDRMFETELEKDMKISFQKQLYDYFKSCITPTQSKMYQK